MNAQAQFWADFYGWCLGLGFITLIVIIGCTIGYLASDNYHKRRSAKAAHLREIEKMKLRAELAKKGMDPEYIKFMEKNLGK